MKKMIFSAAVLMVTFTVSSASARNIWRECGIGGMLFKETGWAAIVSNIIWDLGTTATSSNVSSDDLCEGKSASTAHFIHETYANLEEQTAVGGGEHLVTMLNMMGCDASSHPAIIHNLRSDLQQQMSAPEYSSKSRVEKAESFHNSLMKNVESSFAQECHVI